MRLESHARCHNQQPDDEGQLADLQQGRNFLAGRYRFGGRQTRHHQHRAGPEQPAHSARQIEQAEKLRNEAASDDEQAERNQNAAIGGLTLRVPLLTGGLVSSRVRQAQATWRADRFATDAAERDAIRLAETAWANLAAAQAPADANARRLEAADLALRGVRAEYGFSLSTTLDILIADESLRTAQLAVARSRSDVLIVQAALLRRSARSIREAMQTKITLRQKLESPSGKAFLSYHLPERANDHLRAIEANRPIHA